MKHRRQGRSLGREPSHRQAMLANLATALILHEQVVTTEGKAKEVRRFVEPLVTKAATKSVSTIRGLQTKLPEQGAVRKLVEDLGPKYRDRPGGYTRLTKLGSRPGDGAHQVKLEFV